MTIPNESEPLFSKEEFVTGFNLEPGELTDALFDYAKTIAGEWDQRKIGRRRFAETVMRSLETGDPREKAKAVEALILSFELNLLIGNMMHR